jgi:hypothetical protein
MPEQYYLTEADRDAVAELLRFYRNYKRNRPIFDFTDNSGTYAETYIGKTSEAIAGITEATGTSGDPDTPNYGDCLVYAIQNTTGVDQLFSTGKTVQAYNIGTDTIDADTWCIITKTKHGPWVVLLVSSSSGSGGSGGGGSSGDGCCGGSPTNEYHPTNAPFTSTFEIRRPFGAGSATTSGLNCTLIGEFEPSRKAADIPSWTHVLICESTVDLRDGCSRVGGSNAITHTDGDEVRIPSGASSPRFVVVWCETVNKGETGPDLYEYKRVFLMRHTA